MVATLELLQFLKRDGYIGLIRHHGNEMYRPVKGDLEDIILNLSNIPLKEDHFLCIEMAISYLQEQNPDKFLIAWE